MNLVHPTGNGWYVMYCTPGFIFFLTFCICLQWLKKYFSYLLISSALYFAVPYGLLAVS